MKMKNLFKFFSMMVLVMLGQSALAQGAVVNDFRWSSGELNSIIKPSGAKYRQFEKQTRDSFVTVNVTCDQHDVEYEDRYDASLWTRYYLHVGHIQANALVGGKYSWKPYKQGYSVLMSTLTTETAIPGSYCYYTLGKQKERRIDSDYTLGWKSFSQDSLQEVSEVAYQYRGGSNRENAGRGYGAATNAFSMEYQILPDAPKWKNNPLYITVDSTNIHWYNLKEQVEYNKAFDGTLKFDVQVVRGGEKYMFWSGDTAFYVLKKMDIAIKAYIEASNGKYDSYEEERYGAYLASEVMNAKVTSEIPQGEKCQIFFYNGDSWIQDKNADGINYVNYLVSDPTEHFVEYVCMNEGPVEYVRKGDNCITYQDSVRERRDYFFMNGTEGSDFIEVKIGDAQSTLRINAKGKAKNRVPFTINSQALYDSLKSNEYEVSWVDSYSAQEDQKFDNCVKFSWELAMYSSRVRKYDINFVGVPDSLFFEYGNSADRDKVEFAVYESVDGNTWKQLGETIKGRHYPQPKSAEDGSPVFGAYQLEPTTQYLRFTYTGVQFAGYVKNIKVTEYKRLYANPKDSLIIFDTIVRKPGAYQTKYATLAWANIAPELRFDAKDPFSVKSRIKVRLDQFDENFDNNKFAVLESRDTIGAFYQRMKISSMDVPDPLTTYVTINGVVIYDTEDMFAKVNGQDRDTIKYGDSAIVTIQDKLGTTLFKHDSLILSYEYDTTKMSIDKDGIVRNICVGVYPIVVKAKDNSYVPGGWISDTLYIDARENEKNAITFNFSSDDEIAVHDTLTISALDTVAVLTITASEADALTQLDNNKFVIGSKTYSDSIAIYVKADSTCEHADNYDTIKVWVRGIVNPEFNANIKWMDDVFGNDTLVKPFVVLNEAKTDTINDQVTIAFEYNPNDVVVDSVANQWYMRRSEEKDSLFIMVTVSSDSIKTVKDSIKFPVKEYIAAITWPGTIDDRGFYYVGDTLKVADFTAKAINKEREGKDLTNLVNWTKTFVEAADGTVLEDGSVLLDSVNTSLLQVCLDTLFVKDTCAYDTLIVKPAVVKDLFFPGVDSIYVVGDSIAVKDILVKDTADRDISRYVRYYFEYIPEDFAKNTGDSLNMFIKDEFTDYIVLEKNGLDTAAVDTVVSFTRGGLVTEKEFKDRLLIAPVYAVSVVWADTVFTVGDTVRTDILTAYSGKDNDVTRFSSFIFVAADSIAERINDTTIVMKKAGQVMVKVVAKRNESMHQGKFAQVLTVNPLQAKSVEGYDPAYKVFGALDTKALIYRDDEGNVIPAKYIAATYAIDGAVAAQEGDNIVFNHVANPTTITANLAGNVEGTLPFEVTVNAYNEAVIVYDTTAFVVGDEVDFDLFSVQTADGKEIAESYYTFAYKVSENDARINPENTSMIIDSLTADLTITMASTDIDAVVNPATFVVEAAKLTADRLEFPVSDYKVGEGFAVAEIKVYDADNKDITLYAKNEFTKFEFIPASAAHETDGMIYFDAAGKVMITTTLGEVLVNEATFNNQMFADQEVADTIILPAGPYIVGDTLKRDEFEVWAGSKNITQYITDLSVTLAAADGHAVGDDNVFDRAGQVIVKSEVFGRSSSEHYTQFNTITVEPIKVDSMAIREMDYKVFDHIKKSEIEFFNKGNKINQYVTASYSFDDFIAQEEGDDIVLYKAANGFVVTATASGNAKGEVSDTINIAMYQGAKIMLDQTTYTVGDTLTPAMFRLVDANDNPLSPKYGKYVISCNTPEFGENLDNAILFNKGTNSQYAAQIIADFVDGDVEAAQFDNNVRVNPVEVVKIGFKDMYTLGDTIQLNELKMYNADGEDVTRYAKNAIMTMSAEPNKSADISLENGYVVLLAPGKLVMTTFLYCGDSIAITEPKLKNEIFVDNLAATRIVLPKKEYQVGDTMYINDVRVYAGTKDISSMADVELIINDNEGHYFKDGIVFDEAAKVLVGAYVGGYTGVRSLYVDSNYTVAPQVPFTIKNMPEIANVLQVINVANLIVKNEEGKDITNYVEDVQFEFSNNSAAHYDATSNTIVFDAKCDDLTITANYDGNVKGSVVMNVEVVAFTEAEIKFAKEGQTYDLLDMVELRDFTLVDKATGKLLYTDYQLSINCAAADGEKVGDDIQLKNIGTIQITATVEGQVEIPAANFNVFVNPAKAAYVIYPKDADYMVGKSIDIADIDVMDAKNREITDYLNVADFSFTSVPTDAAKKEGEQLSFYQAGKVEVTAIFGNQFVTKAEIPTILAIDQIVAKNITLDDSEFTVGESLSLSQVHVWDAAGVELTDADIFFLVDDKVSHLDGDNLVFDDVKATTVTVGIKGYKNVAKAALEAPVTVNALEAVRFAIDGLQAEYMLFEQFNTNGKVQIFDADGNDVTDYADFNVTVDNEYAKISNGIISFVKVGEAKVFVALNGDNVKAAAEYVDNTSVLVGKYTEELTIVPTKEYVVGEVLTAADFKVMAGDQDVTALATLSVSCEASEGTQAGDDIILNKKAGTAAILVEVSSTQITKDPTLVDVKVAMCEAYKVVVNGSYKVGDPIAFAAIEIQDKNGKNITEFMTLDDSNFQFAPANAAHIDGENIILDMAGRIALTTKVGSDLMKEGTLNTILTVSQIVADDATITPNEFIVGEYITMDNVAILANSEEISKDYADLSFNFASSIAHMDGDKLVFDQVGNQTIYVVVAGKAGVAAKVLPVQVTVSAIKAVDFVGMKPDYKVFDQFDTKNISIVGADGQKIDYATFDVTIDDSGNARLVDGIIYFDKAGQVDVTVTLTTNNVVWDPAAANLTKTVEIAKYNAADVVFPAKDYVVSNIMTLADLQLVDANKQPISAENARITKFVIDADNENTIEYVNGDTTQIMFIKATTPATAAIVKVAVEGEVELDADAESYNIGQCEPEFLILPQLEEGENYMVSDSIKVSEIRLYDKYGVDITRFGAYQSFTFDKEGVAKMDETNENIVLVMPGRVMMTILVYSEDMVEKTFVKRIGVDAMEALDITYQAGPYHVGDTLFMDSVKVFDAEKEITDRSDLFFIFDANEAHLIEGGNLVLDTKGEFNFQVAVKGYDGVAKQSFNVTIEVEPRAVKYIQLAGEFNYQVLGAIDTKLTVVTDMFDNDITNYATLKYDFNADSAHWDGDKIVFDKVGQVLVTVTANGNVADTVFVKAMNVAPCELAAIEYPVLNNYRVGDEVPVSIFRVMLDGKDVTDYATMHYDFAAGDAHFLTQDSTIIVLDTANLALPVYVSVSGNISIAATQCDLRVMKCQAADVIFPELGYKVTDSIAIADLKVLDAQNRDLTVYAEYLKFEFQPADAAIYDAATGYIYIQKPGVITITTTVGGDKMEQKDLVDAIGVLQTAAATVVLADNEYTVGETIDITLTKVYAENGFDLTPYCDLTYNFAEGYAHFDAAGNIVVDKKGENYINVVVEGHDGVTKQTMVPALKVNPCVANSVVIPAGPYYVLGTINLNDALVYDANGKDITEYAALSYTFVPNDAAILTAGILAFEKAGDLELTITLDGPDAISAAPFVQILVVEPYQYAKVIFPADPDGGYHLNDVILKSDLKVVDADGNDITEYATLEFVNSNEVVVTADGDAKLVKSGEIIVKVTIGGNCKVETVEQAITVLQYTSEIIFGQDKYYVGDTLASVIVMEGDSNVTAFATDIQYSFSNDSIAHYDKATNHVVLDKAGDVTLTITAKGEGITDATLTVDMHVRHVEDGCYDLLVRVWEDMLMVDNENEDLPKFVNYVWYKDEYVIEGQTTQNFYARDIDRDGKAHVYYVRAYDANGNEYLICEKEFIFTPAQSEAKRFMVYPTMMSTSDEYTIDTEVMGEVVISTANGNTMERFMVESGLNSVQAPMAAGVYVLHFQSQAGQIATQKLIVK